MARSGVRTRTGYNASKQEAHCLIGNTYSKTNIGFVFVFWVKGGQQIAVEMG